MTPCCRVCGTELAGELVSCERCDTPHHRDCWEYWGRCATYGCSSEPPEPRHAVADEPAVLEVRGGGDHERARYLPRRALVEARGALMYSADGAHVRLAAGEVALQLPADLALELPAKRFPRNLGAVRVAAGTLAFLAAGYVLLFSGHFPGHDAYLILAAACWTVAYRRIANRFKARRADRMWMVQDREGTLALEAQVSGALGPLTAVRMRFPLVMPGGVDLRATGVRLRPAFGGGEERAVVKAYRLLLACELPGGGAELIAPVAVPGKGEPRADFLRELTRVRALGRQIATHYRVPYEES